MIQIKFWMFASVCLLACLHKMMTAVMKRSGTEIRHFHQRRQKRLDPNSIIDDCIENGESNVDLR